MTQVCSQLLPLFSCVEQLEIREGFYASGQVRSGNGMDSSQWLELFRPFPGVQSLTVYEELVAPVARALRELAGRGAMQVLPALRNLDFKGPSPSTSIREDVEAFVTARQHTNSPVDVFYSPWPEPPSP